MGRRAKNKKMRYYQYIRKKKAKFFSLKSLFYSGCPPS